MQSSERTIRLDAGMFTPQTSDGQEWLLILVSLLTRLTRIRQSMWRAMMAEPVSLEIDPPNSCRWVVFDAVGTLMEPDPTVAVAYHRVGAKYGSRLSVADVGARFRRAFRVSETDSFPGGPEPGERWRTSDSFEEQRWRWIVREVFPEVRDQEGCFRELWDHFARPTSWRCFDDVADALLSLSETGYRLAIASNFDRRLHPVCEGLAELKGIERRVVSAAVGFRKPAPEFYAAVTAACEGRAHEILMIGDSMEHDVVGPRSAGFRAIHLDRQSRSSGSDHITSLTGLVDRLAT